MNAPLKKIRSPILVLPAPSPSPGSSGESDSVGPYKEEAGS